MEGRAAKVERASLLAFAALLALFEAPAEIACVFALVATFATHGLRGFRPGAVEIGVGVWILAGLPGMFAPDFSSSSQGMLRPLASLALIVGMNGIGRADDRLLGRLAIAFALACVINGAYGYVQVFWAEPGLESLLRGRSASTLLVDPDSPNRLRMATGLFYNRLKLAHVGVVGLGLLGLVAVNRPNRRALALAGFVLLAGALFLTYRRAAPASLVLAATALALVQRRVRLASVVLAVGIAVVALFGVTEYGRERLADSSIHFDERLEIFSQAAKLFLDRPWFGVGHGGYQAAIVAEASLMKANLTTSAHNMFLQVLVETGAVGFIGFASAVGAALIGLVLRVRHAADERTGTALLDRFALLGLFAILALGMMHAVLYHSPVGLLFWALLGVAHRPPR